MASLGTLYRCAASAALVTAAACAEKITQGQSEGGESRPDATASVSGTNAKPPVLTIVAIDGKAAVFLHGAPPSPSGLFYTFEVSGTGFTPGADFVSHNILVGLDGSRRAVGTGIGENPADGTFRGAWGASCPSNAREAYVEVISNGVRTETKHVAPTC